MLFIVTFACCLGRTKLFSTPETKGPAGDDPEGHHEHEEHGAWAYGHQSLEHESGVEVYSVESANAPGRGVGEELRVQQHHSADEVEAKEHGQGQRHVVGHPSRPYVPALVRQLGGPQEVVLSRDGVHCANAELEADLRDPLPRHRYPPVMSFDFSGIKSCLTASASNNTSSDGISRCHNFPISIPTDNERFIRIQDTMDDLEDF
ncbi:hypothetical protein C0J52_26465 [Blattella germanica]|nr:hypothetical protein C0J52_26465 [Blattella germanica]